MSVTKNVVESFREVVQDPLVPKLKAVKVSVDSPRTEMRLTTEAIREEMKLSNTAIHEEMKLNKDAFHEEMRLHYDSLERTTRDGDERNAQLVRDLADKLDLSIEIRERLASIEARLPRQ